MLIGGLVALIIRASLDRVARLAATTKLELVESMRERNAELMNLSGALAHELKNPLASIQGLSGLMARKLEPESKEAEQMGVLLGEVKRMASILDEFLNFSRPLSDLSVQSVSPDELVEDVVPDWLLQGIDWPR